MTLSKSRLALVLMILVFVAGSLYFQLRTLEVEQLSDDLYVFRGIGGNTAVLRTTAGTVIVDSMILPMLGARIRDEAKTLTGSDTVLLINTHYHLDHTHGNPAFDSNIRILSTEQTLSHLMALDANFWSGDAAKLLPNEMVTNRQTLTIGDKTLLLVQPGPAHTDGDLVVVFVDEGVVHVGDLLFNGYYPIIDLEAGGSVQQWPETLERVMALTFDRVIPGHGPTAGRSELLQYQSFMRELAEIGRNVAARGSSLEDTISTEELTTDAAYKSMRFLIPLGINREFVLTRAWEEATGNFERKN